MLVALRANCQINREDEVYQVEGDQKPNSAINIGSRKVVIRPFKPIARPAAAPARRLTSSILAVPIPWADVPMASPIDTGEVTPIRRQNSGPQTAPRQPVRTTSAAVRGAMPPILSTILMAIGVVTDFGARERITSRLPPRIQARPQAEMIEAREPAKMPIRISRLRFQISSRRW